jgi:ribosomal protein S18 acetylase RimI-like enzyme
MPGSKRFSSQESSSPLSLVKKGLVRRGNWMSSWIDSGKIRRNSKTRSHRSETDGDYCPYEMKFLNKDSLRELVGLQNLIGENLSEPEIFKLHNNKDFKNIFQSENSVIGVETVDGLVAYSIIRIPGLADDNLGRDIELPREEHTEVAHLQATAVHPLFRGNGLQQKMARAHLDELEKMGYKHVCCTVSPRNPISLANIMSCGFVIKGLIPKFDNWWRYIMYKGIISRSTGEGAGANNGTGNVTSNVTSNITIAVNNTDSNMSVGAGTLEEIKINCSDIECQIDLLKRGFEGFRMDSRSRRPEVFYRKF